MKIVLPFFFLLVLNTQLLFAGEKNNNSYSSAELSEKLCVGANAVIRDKTTDVIIKNNHQIVINETIATTVLNQQGIELAELVIPYDEFSEIFMLEGVIYDSNGKIIRKLKSTEFYDGSVHSAYTIFQDSRYKSAKVNYSIFPFTVEYKYQLRIDGFITPPSWDPVERDKLALEKALLSITVKNGIKFRHKEFLLSGPEIINESKEPTYKWNIQNFPAVISEKNVPADFTIFPQLLYCTDNFQIDNYSGNINTWNDFGNFYAGLNVNTSFLSTEAKSEIKSALKNETDDLTKTKLLYQWMQSKVRYVSVQQGIGGWKPYSAEYVYKNKFGDCKALANYMKSCLEAAGVTSYPVLVNAGEDPSYFNSEFPYNYFNHVILMVPLKSDTCWLECTSQGQPFNYLGGFTSDRYGLMIDGNSSRLVSTPVYKTQANHSELTGDIIVSPDGLSKCRIKKIMSGELQDEIRMFQYDASTKHADDWVRNQMEVTDFNIISRNFLPPQKDSAVSGIEINLESSSLSGISGSRIFIHPKLFKNKFESIPVTGVRKFPLELPTSHTEKDSIIIHLPENYIPESAEKHDSIKNDYAEFEYSVLYNKESGTITLVNKISITKHIIQPAEYNGWLEFNNKVNSIRSRTIVCKKA